MRVRLSEPTVGEEEAAAAAAAIRAGNLTFGPELETFEAGLAARAGTPGAVAVSSGTAALHLALLAVGVTPGSEVWVSDLTFAATANAVRLCGAEPVLVDSEPGTWNLDPEPVVGELRRRAGAGRRLPAAIVPVHLLGHPADLAPVLEVAGELGVPVVEDAAEALGARWTAGPLAPRAAGGVGTAGILSFNFNKIISTGGGGAVVSPDPTVLDDVRHRAAQAKIPGSDYRHDRVGFNYRLPNVAAAIGVRQLARLDGLVEARRELAARYAAALSRLGLGSGPDAAWAHRTGWLATAVFPDAATRRRARAALEAAGIETRPIWPPLRHQLPYRACRVLGGTVAVDLAARVLCLPCSAHLPPAVCDEVVALIGDAIGAGAPGRGRAARMGR